MSPDEERIKELFSDKSSTVPKNIKERKQKEFTASQIADMSSELTKANRKLRSGVFTQIQYKEERNRIFKKYDITKSERETFLGKKFANWYYNFARNHSSFCQFHRITILQDEWMYQKNRGQNRGNQE